jgi:hypothetical protein
MALTVSKEPESGLDCLTRAIMFALTVLSEPVNGLDCLIRARKWPWMSYKNQKLALTVLYEPENGLDYIKNWVSIWD